MRKILIIIAIVLVIAGIIFYLISLRSENQSPTTLLNNAPTALNNSINNTTTAEVDQSLQQKDALATLARTFIERYGTWSNQSDFENFTDLYPYMTDELKIATQDFVLRQRTALTANSLYYGLTTRFLSWDLTNIITDASADLFANVQQQETKDGQTTILSKKATLKFIKQGADWKVSQINFSF